MSPAGFEPTIPANERPQTHALDCAATGIGTFSLSRKKEKKKKKRKKKVKLKKVIFCLCSSLFETALRLGRFPSFAHFFPFW
jgi:hypothetical protein